MIGSKLARVAVLAFATVASQLPEASAMTLQQFHEQKDTRIDYVKKYIQSSIIDRQTDATVRQQMQQFFLESQGRSLSPGMAAVLGLLAGAEQTNIDNASVMSRPDLVERAIDLFVQKRFPQANVSIHQLAIKPR